MSTQEIAMNLVNWFNKGEESKCIEELYSPEIESIESGDGQHDKGLEAIKKKGEWWEENFEVHSAKASEPIVADNWFATTFTMDTTHKPSGNRSTMKEIAIYRVKDGKIVREEFFYDQEGA